MTSDYSSTPTVVVTFELFELYYCLELYFKRNKVHKVQKSTSQKVKLETVSIAEPLQNRQHAPLMLSTLGSKEKREGG